MSTTMTTRSKKQGTQPTVTAVDSQETLLQGSSATINNLNTSAEPTATLQGANLDPIEAQANNPSMIAECHASSSLTPTGTPEVDMNREMMPTTTTSPRLSGTFHSTDDQRQSVLEKSKSTTVEHNWCTGNNEPVLTTASIEITPTSSTMESKHKNVEPELIPVLKDDNTDSEFSIAEFKSNRPLSPEDDIAPVDDQDLGHTIPATVLGLTNDSNPDDDDQSD